MPDLAAGWPAMVASLVSDLRPELEPLQIDRVAARLRVTVVYHRFPGPTRAATLDPRTIVLDTRLTRRAAARSFGHEVAHLMISRGLFSVPPAHEELFADWLGRELSLPRAWIDGRLGVPVIARRYEVPQALVAVQLATLGLAPQLQQLGGAVLCATCGDVEHNISCGCNRWRRRPRYDRLTLPDARKQECWKQRHLRTSVQETLGPFQSYTPIPVH